MEYTREELISICENSIVPQDNWTDRDSAQSIRQVGEAWALLKAGCEFKVITEKNASETDKQARTITDDKTIWLNISFKGFAAFEGGDIEDKDFWLPTRKALEESKGGDWY